MRDVLIIPTLTSDGDWERFPPFAGDPVALGRGLRLEVLGHDEAELVMNACTERGHYFWAIRQFGALYAFVLDVELEAYDRHNYAWDVDGVLRRALELSRFIRDNGYSAIYAARIVDFDSGQQQVIPQGGWHLYYLASYRLRDDRDWLTHSEAEELAVLLDQWWAHEAQLPLRVQRAVSLAEGVVHQAVIERALVMLFMGFEALVNTDKNQVTKQVGVRLRALGEELEVDGISRRFVEDMYGDRSSPAHGQELKKLYRGTPDSPAEAGQADYDDGDDAGAALDREYLTKLARLQDFQRAVLRKAIADPAFAAIFSSNDTIDRRWSVAGEADAEI